jgi:hypothetical protein
MVGAPAYRLRARLPTRRGEHVTLAGHRDIFKAGSLLAERARQSDSAPTVPADRISHLSGGKGFMKVGSCQSSNSTSEKETASSDRNRTARSPSVK